MPQGSLHHRDSHAGPHPLPLANTVMQASNRDAGLNLWTGSPMTIPSARRGGLYRY
jgi:hypothetical protein